MELRMAVGDGTIPRRAECGCSYESDLEGIYVCGQD